MAWSMRISGLVAAVALLGLSACDSIKDREAKPPIPNNVVDAAGLNDLLLTAGNPEESILFFQQALSQEPDRADFRRGLAISMTRAKQYLGAARVYEEMIALKQAEPADRLEYGLVQARLNKWDQVRQIIAGLPAGLNSSRRHLVDAMLADHQQDWGAADQAYARAESLTTNPATILNNWGVSLMSRGELPRATATFERALSYNSRLFSAKNNLAISRGLQGNFELPVVPMTSKERAIVLYNLGVIAIRKGEQRVAKGLLAAAVDSHPQHYPAAADQLAALEGAVEN